VIRNPKIVRPNEEDYSLPKKPAAGLVFLLAVSSYLHPQQLLHFRFVEADDNIVADANNRDTHLAGHFNHLLTLFGVGGNIDIGKFDAIVAEEVFSGMAEMARRRTVNGYGFVHTKVITLYTPQ